MTSRRDWLLQQMGITQYQLRRPRVLQGEIAVRLMPDTRLIIVANVPPGLHEPLVRDVLHVLGLQPAQVMTLTPDQLLMLPESTPCAGWLIGIDCTHPFTGVALYSSSLSELSSSGAAKRALWQQMCNHDSDLFPHP
ncbi:DNA polymerase III subunit psi [Candidatus Pantoea persica]|uniref:DNA polymerase III subunit psi n=1 Tax=Candidatus Pantoea persica TaxID=2518128 RepID=UPI00215D6136|nr:DNA polymerase III subunit psi [Candidatus Pantoea persica]MBA2815858.1 DNA polymerase III subunit psi [Candidatus Pantoea persica]